MPFQDAEMEEMEMAGVPLVDRVKPGDWLGWLVVIVFLVLSYLYVVRPIMGSVVGPSKDEQIAAVAGMASLPQGRSAEFQAYLEQLAGQEGDGDPLERLIRNNQPGALRNLQSWIEEG